MGYLAISSLCALILVVIVPESSSNLLWGLSFVLLIMCYFYALEQ